MFATPLLNCIKQLGAAPDEVIYDGDSAVDYQTTVNAAVAFRLFTDGYLNEPLPAVGEKDRFDDWSAHGIPLTW